MNPLVLGSTAWSFRKELMYVLFTFVLVLFLPVVAVVTITRVGIDVVSDSLVNVDSTGKTVQILSPIDGTVLTEVNTTVVWPVLGVITLQYGQSSKYQLFHSGLDIANSNGRIGDPITPLMNGTVTHVGNLSWGYGKHVIVDHGDNTSTVYAHLNSVHVTKGQLVSIGDIIGTEGQTGWATGPHLHLEVRVYGIPVDPMVFLSS